MFVCIYYERAPRLCLEELYRRYEKGEVGDALAYRILHSIVGIYSACGWGARDVTSLEIECHSKKKRHNIPCVGWWELFCSFSSRFSFRFSKLLCTLRHATVFTTKTVIVIEDEKFRSLSSKLIEYFNFILRTHDSVYHNAIKYENCLLIFELYHIK